MAVNKAEKRSRHEAPQAPIQRAEDRRERRRALRGSQNPASWEGCTEGTLIALVVAVTECGGAVSFGKTRDGGALILTIFHDKLPAKEYFRPSDDLDALLGDIALDYERQTLLPGIQ